MLVCKQLFTFLKHAAPLHMRQNLLQQTTGAPTFAQTTYFSSPHFQMTYFRI
jgi:hypothetical protein